MHKCRLQVSNNYLAAGLGAATVALIVARLALPGDIYVNVWGDRDLWRALSVPDHWPLLGPESNGGIRTPGGAFYLILWVILAISHNVTTINAVVVLSYAASVLVIGIFFARRISPLAGALIAASLASSVIVGEILGVWNPGFVLIFATAATVFGYSFLADGRPLTLALATAALAIGMQVHLQITQVALGLILATVIYRRRLTWQHAVAIVVGLVVPYLPNLLLGSASLLRTASSLPNNAISNYVFWDVARLPSKVNLFAKLFGGTASEYAIHGSAWRISLIVSDLTMLLLATGGIFAMLRSPRKYFSGPPSGFLVLILLVNVGTLLISDLQVRHMVAATPAAAALIGLAAERAVIYLERGGPVAHFAAAIFCGLFAIRLVPPIIAGLAPHPFRMASVAAQSEIVAALKPTIYVDRDAFDAHVAEFTRNAPHHWLVVSNGIPNHMSFLYQTFPAAKVGVNRENCMAIVAKSDAGGDLRNDLAASPSLAGLGATVGETVIESAHFLYVPYNTRDGNCLKTFPNGYIPTDFETAYLAANSPAAAQAINGGVVFVVPQPSQRDPIGIELRRENSNYVAIMHGRLLRGYTGLYFYSIIAPSLCFAGEQNVHVVRFSNVAIGSPQRTTLAPWRSPIFALPDGRYQMWLIGTEMSQPTAIRRVIGDLHIPDMVATVQSPAATQPPAECFARNRPAN